MQAAAELVPAPSLDHLVGKEINFEAQPYQQGKAVIVSITPEPLNQWVAQYTVKVRTTDATETSRLFSARLDKPYNDREVVMSRCSKRAIEQAVETGASLIYVYPV